jgi:hypothetical protein
VREIQTGARVAGLLFEKDPVEAPVVAPPVVQDEIKQVARFLFGDETDSKP